MINWPDIDQIIKDLESLNDPHFKSLISSYEYDHIAAKFYKELAGTETDRDEFDVLIGLASHYGKSTLALSALLRSQWKEFFYKGEE